MNLGELWETAEDRGAWRAAVHGGRKESDTTEHLKNSNNNANEHESWNGQSPHSNRSFFGFVSSGLSCGMWALLWPANTNGSFLVLSRLALAVACGPSVASTHKWKLFGFVSSGPSCSMWALSWPAHTNGSFLGFVSSGPGCGTWAFCGQHTDSLVVACT